MVLPSCGQAYGYATEVSGMQSRSTSFVERTHVERWLAGVCLIALSAVYLFLQPGGDLMVAARKRELPIYNVSRTEKVLSISFDAAWGDANTLKLLDLLDQYNVKTTFFLVGIWVERYPELVQEIVARGHEIGNHSTTHPHMTQCSDTKIIQELRVTSDRIEELTGIRPSLFRPPYGDYNDKVVTLSRQEGYECIQWNVDSLDWKNLGAQNMITQSTRKVASGDIVLFHNDSKYLLDALPTILDRYVSLGYQVIPISELLLQGETTIDYQGTQHPKDPNPQGVSSI